MFLLKNQLRVIDTDREHCLESLFAQRTFSIDSSPNHVYLTDYYLLILHA